MKGHFLKQPFHSHQALCPLERKMEGLAAQLVMPGVEECNDGRTFAEVPPGTLENIVLPFHLFGCRRRHVAAPSKGQRLTSPAIGRGILVWRARGHVTNPGRARLAPDASRLLRICSA
jgi:hypothetical protein